MLASRLAHCYTASGFACRRGRAAAAAGTVAPETSLVLVRVRDPASGIGFADASKTDAGAGPFGLY